MVACRPEGKTTETNFSKQGRTDEAAASERIHSLGENPQAQRESTGSERIHRLRENSQPRRESAASERFHSRRSDAAIGWFLEVTLLLDSGFWLVFVGSIISSRFREKSKHHPNHRNRHRS